jgi:thiol-disulfide isomerase/thioredoxin
MIDNKYGHENSNVYELMAHNFRSENDKIILSHNLTNKKYGIVKFYAPWCGHCTNMIPVLEFLAKKLPNMSKPFFVAAVNCTNTSVGNDLLAKKCGIKGFPTLFFVNLDGELEDFNPSSRSIEGLLEEICKCTERYNSNNICCKYSNNKLTCS